MNTAHAHTLLTTSPGGCAPGPHSGHICTTQNRFRRAGIGVNPTLTVAPAGAVRARIPAGRVCPFWAGCKHTAGNRQYPDDLQNMSLRTEWCARSLQQHCRSTSALRTHDRCCCCCGCAVSSRCPPTVPAMSQNLPLAPAVPC